MRAGIAVTTLIESPLLAIPFNVTALVLYTDIKENQ